MKKMEKVMFRTLILAGASAMALSLAGGGLALANDAQNDSNNHQVWSGAKAEHSQQSSQQAMNAAKGGTGAARDEVKQAQQKLHSEGLYKGKIDGMEGPETQQAVKEFQQKNQLQQSGELDQETLAKLGINEQMQGSGSSQPSPGTSGGSMGSPTTHSK